MRALQPWIRELSALPTPAMLQRISNAIADEERFASGEAEAHETPYSAAELQRLPEVLELLQTHIGELLPKARALGDLVQRGEHWSQKHVALDFSNNPTQEQ